MYFVKQEGTAWALIIFEWAKSNMRSTVISAMAGALSLATASFAEDKAPVDPRVSDTVAEPAKAADAAATEEADSEQPPAVDIHGQFGLGVRLFRDQPAKTERWKFEQYGEIPSGLFLQDASIEAVIHDRYVANLWASHPAENNENFLFQVSDPGHINLTLEWDQTPHLASTRAQTLYEFPSPDRLTIPASVRQALEDGNDEERAETIAANLRPVTVNVDRNTARIGVKYTPSPEWTMKLDYSHEERNGQQVFGAPINKFNAIETLAPVFYTTRNFSANVEYVGKWTDDKKFSLAAGYAGSLFENKYLSFTWDNPFRLDAPSGSNSANQGRNSLPPDNQAHRITLTGAVDLPFDSRYVATFSHNRMTQNSPFIPFTINSALNGDCPFPLSDVRCLPKRSLNGEIVQTLYNNQLTTRFSPDLTSTLRFRHLSVDNRTPRIVFEEWVRWDGEKTGDARGNTTPGYDRTNTGIDVNWSPVTGLKLGGTLGWEQFNHIHADVRRTEEFSKKLSVNYNPEELGWLTLRGSYLQASRDFDRYDARGNVGVIGHPDDGGDYPQSEAMRKMYLAKRDRNKAEIFAEMAFDSGWIITPTASWRQDQFSDRVLTGGELGLKRENYWSAGVEQTYPISDEITLSFAYMRENYERHMVGGEDSGDSDAWGSRITDVVDTLEGQVSIALSDMIMPGDLNVDIGLVLGRTNNRTFTYAVDGGNEPDEQYPDVKNNFQRFDTTFRYNVDPDLVSSLGWDGEATVKLRYAYERNRMTNWQTDVMVPYMADVNDDADESLFLAAINPNYEASIITLEVGLTW